MRASLVNRWLYDRMPNRGYATLIRRFAGDPDLNALVGRWYHPRRIHRLLWPLAARHFAARPPTRPTPTATAPHPRPRGPRSCAARLTALRPANASARTRRKELPAPGNAISAAVSFADRLAPAPGCAAVPSGRALGVAWRP